MAVSCLRCNSADHNLAGLDFDNPSPWDLSKEEMEARRNVLAREAVGCQFEFVGYWIGNRKYYYGHE
jgi:hypothetical protein